MSDSMKKALADIYLYKSITNVRDAYEDTSFKLKEINQEGITFRELVPVYPTEEERSRNLVLFRKIGDGKVTKNTKMWVFSNRGSSIIRTIKEIVSVN